MSSKSLYVSYREVKKVYDVSSQTLHNWAKNGHIDHKKIKNAERNTWLYNIESIDKYMSNSNKKNIIYVRISDKNDLELLNIQKKYLKSKYTDCIVIEDISSSINYNREGFNTLLTMIFSKEVNNIYITDKSRIGLYSYEMFNKFCNAFNCKIIIDSEDKEMEKRLVTKEFEIDILLNKKINYQLLDKQLNNPIENKKEANFKNIDDMLDKTIY